MCGSVGLTPKGIPTKTPKPNGSEGEGLYAHHTASVPARSPWFTRSFLIARRGRDRDFRLRGTCDALRLHCMPACNPTIVRSGTTQAVDRREPIHRNSLRDDSDGCGPATTRVSAHHPGTAAPYAPEAQAFAWSRERHFAAAGPSNIALLSLLS